MGVSFFIASRLRRGADRSDRRLSSISNTIAWVSVAVSVAVMLIAMAVLGGFKKEIRYKVTGFSGSIQITGAGSDYTTETDPIPSSFPCMDSLRGLECVKSLQAVSFRTGLVKTGDEIHGMLFKGVDSTYNLSFFESALVDGSVPDYHGRISNDILISRRVASLLGYGVGDELMAYYIGADVKMRKFTVCGIYDIQLEDIDRTLAIIDARHVNRLNGWKAGEVSSLEVALRNGFTEDEAYTRIYDVMASRSDASSPRLIPIPVSSRYRNLFDWLNLLDFNVAAVLLLMMLVAGFNMISALLIILFEKISMIGLLKAMGMTVWGVCRVFLCRALHILARGVACGTAVALAFCLLQDRTRFLKLDPANYFVDFVPIRVSLRDVLLVDFGSVAVMLLLLTLTSIFIAGVNPARTMKVE